MGSVKIGVAKKVEQTRKRIEDLTLFQLFWLDCPEKDSCKGRRCVFRERNGRCSLELTRGMREVMKLHIPGWLQPAIDEADQRIAYCKTLQGD